MNAKTVILLKSQIPEHEEQDAFLQEFQDSPHFRAKTLSALQFSYVNQDLLRNHLQQRDYDGMILTSVRAVRSVEQCLTGMDTQHWAQRPIFVVGPKSGRNVRDLLHWPEILGEDCGNAENLVAQMLQVPRKGQKMLFPCGQLKGDVLPEKLVEAGVTLDIITSYITQENPDLKSLLAKESHPPDFMVFFSPSGFKFALPVMRNLGWDLNRIQMVALGPTTAQCIKDHGYSVLTTPSQPTPKELLNSLLKYKDL